MQTVIQVQQIQEEVSKGKQAEDMLELRNQQTIVREQLLKLPTT